MITKRIATLVSAVLIASTLSACYFLPDEEEILAPPTIKAKEVSYTTITVKKKDFVKQVINSGSVISGTEVEEIFDEQSGNIKTIHVRSGDEVKKGQLIAELETYDLDYRVETQRLYVKKATLTHKIAIEKKLSQAEIDSAKIDIQLQQNELDQLIEQQNAAKLYASMTGTVSYSKDYQIGEYINAGTVLVKIIDSKDLSVKIAPTDYTPYKKGQDVIIKLNNKEFDGEVVYTPTEAEEDDNVDELKNVTVNFKGNVISQLADSVGSIADVILVQNKVEDAIVITNSVIKTVDGNKVVYLLKDDQKVEQPIEVGVQSSSESEIKSGLQVGDLIIVR